MKNAQIINIKPVDQGGDSFLSFIGNDVIDSSTQLPIISPTTISVALNLLDLTDESEVQITGLTMTYHSGTTFWTIPIADIASNLSDRHKYVGSIVEESPFTANMRTFQIMEFAVDNDGFEDTWMRLPYQIKIECSVSKFIWYEVGHLGSAGYEVWMADAYEGGTGTTLATSAERVTHRGPVIPYA